MAGAVPRALIVALAGIANPNNFFEGTDVADNQLFQKVTSIESARLNVATEEN